VGLVGGSPPTLADVAAVSSVDRRYADLRLAGGAAAAAARFGRESFDFGTDAVRAQLEAYLASLAAQPGTD
jgi:hypothetical protein